jgi:hypothetical protein
VQRESFQLFASDAIDCEAFIVKGIRGVLEDSSFNAMLVGGEDSQLYIGVQ